MKASFPSLLCQIIKLEKMKIQGMEAQAHYAPVKTIVNINKHQLSTSEKSVLNKGLNFANNHHVDPLLRFDSPS